MRWLLWRWGVSWKTSKTKAKMTWPAVTAAGAGKLLVLWIALRPANTQPWAMVSSLNMEIISRLSKEKEVI